MILLINWLVSTLILLAATKLAPGFTIDTFTTALVAALLLGLVNAIIRPILLVLTLPINLLTLGLFTLVVNGLMLWLVASVLSGVHIATFGDAIFAGVILWLLNWALMFLTNRSIRPMA